MRLSTVGRFALVLVAVAAAACDSRTITGSASSGRVQIAIPWLGGFGPAARQTAPGAYEVVGLRVMIKVLSTGDVLLDRTYTGSDGVFTFIDPPVNDVSATGSVEFRLPPGAAAETFELTIEALNAAGSVLYKIGPATFHLEADGHSATVGERAVYVGPNPGVTSVQIQPRSITVVAGQTRPISCLGNPGGVSDFARTFDSDNIAIAIVENFTSVRGVAPGTTRITCNLDWGTHATDAINVVVTAVAASVASVTVAPSVASILIGGTQQLTATVRDAGGNTLTGRAVTWQTSSATVATVSPAGLVTGNAAGSVTITATSEGMSGTALVSVTVASTTGGVSGVVQNASNGLPLSGTLVEVRAGSATTGTLAAPSVTTTALGTFVILNLAPGPYTVLATATGFAAVSVAATVVSGQATPVVIALPPAAAGISIVLTWGAIPDDLDSYLFMPSTFGTISFINLGNCLSVPFACLVNDETSPNSSEFTNITAMQQGTYTFKVHDYTNGSSGLFSSTALANSRARVDVFVSGVLQRTFTVPSQAGVLWTVFTLAGSITAPTITAVNTMQQVNPVAVVTQAGQSALKASSRVKRTP